jgi:hypothetical protein
MRPSASTGHRSRLRSGSTLTTKTNSEKIIGKFGSFPNFEFVLKIAFSGSANTFNFTRYDSSATGDDVFSDNFGGLSTGAWYFVVFALNTSTNLLKISVNNGTPNTAASTGVISAGSAPLEIGAVNGGGYVNGLIDQVGIWKRDLFLTPSDLTALYNSGNGLAYSGM